MKSGFLCLAFFIAGAPAFANPCSSNTDCPGENNYCDAGQCTVQGTGQCTTNDDCAGQDNFCVEGECVCDGSDCGQSSAAIVGRAKTIFTTLQSDQWVCNAGNEVGFGATEQQAEQNALTQCYGAECSPGDTPDGPCDCTIISCTQN